MNTKISTIVGLLIFGTTAIAGGNNNEHRNRPVTTPVQQHSNNSNRNANTIRNTNSNRNTNQNSNRNVQNASSTASGGAATAEVTQGDVNINHSQVKQAPSLGQGSFAIQGCGVAGNAGGSNSNGAAFLGLGFTPAQCYDFMLAQAYQALGERKAACEILNNTEAGKRAAKKGVKLPSCDDSTTVTVIPVVSPEVITPPVTNNEFVTKDQAAGFVTRDELKEREDRMMRTLSAK